MNISQNIYIFADLILLSIVAIAADFMLFFEQVKATSEARNHNSLLQEIKHHIELRRNNNVASVFAEFSESRGKVMILFAKHWQMSS